MTTDSELEKIFANDPEMLVLLRGFPDQPKKADTCGALAMQPSETTARPLEPKPTDLLPFPDASPMSPEAQSAEAFLRSLAKEVPKPSDIDTTDFTLENEFFSNLFSHFEPGKKSVALPDFGCPALVAAPDADLVLAENPSQASPSTPVAVPVSRNKKIVRFVCNVFFYLFCAAILVGAVGVALSSDTTKSYFGYRFYNVRTPSMTPQAGGPAGGFYAGDLIVVQLCDASEVAVGDIITFVPGQAATATLTHRVVDIKYELGGTPGIYFVTRGDANDSDDPPIRGDGDKPMLIGKKVFSVPLLGSVIEFVQQNLVLSLVFVLSVFALVLVLQHYFFAKKSKAIRPEKQKRIPA